MGGCCEKSEGVVAPRTVRVGRGTELWACEDGTRYLVERGRHVSSAVRAVVAEEGGGTRVHTRGSVYVLAHSPPPVRAVTWATLLRARLEILEEEEE